MPTTDVCSRTTTLFSNDDTDGKDSFTVVLYFSDWRDVALTVMEFLSRELLFKNLCGIWWENASSSPKNNFILLMLDKKSKTHPSRAPKILSPVRLARYSGPYACL
jgi:hypothetical protein